MANLTILYWRDIPSQVIVKSGRNSAKRELSERFIRAIHAAAMRAHEPDADAYLAESRRAEPTSCGDDLEAEASAAAARLEAEYDAHRLAELAKRGGREARVAVSNLGRRGRVENRAASLIAPLTPAVP